MPQASVIIPAYNAAAFIERAVTTALRQTLKDIEVLVVDDGSTDATATIVQSLAQKDSSLRLIRLPSNRGVSAARNAALEVARGDWIATLDADDWYDEERLERLVAAGKDAEIVVDNRYQLYEGRDERNLFLPDEGSATFHVPSAEYAARCTSSEARPWSALFPIYRRSLIDRGRIRFDERLKTGEDTLFLFLALDLAPGVMFVSKPGYFRVVRKDSLSFSAPLACQAAFIAVLREALEKDWRNAELRIAVQAMLRTSECNHRIRRIGRPLKRGQIIEGMCAALRDPGGAFLLLRHLARAR